MPLTLIRQDITKLEVDAIVNAANQDLVAGGGVCGAIFAAAGRADLQRACDEIGHVDTGKAVATPAFALSAKHVIHTAGPVWRGGYRFEDKLLASCYRTSLELAHSLGDTSIAFPLISSGIYGYPVDEALSVAVKAIRSYLKIEPDMEVTLCLFDRRATTLSESVFGAIAHYIDDAYVDASPYRREDRVPESRDDFYAIGGFSEESVAFPAMADSAKPATPSSAAPAQAHPYPTHAAPQAQAGPHAGQKKGRRRLRKEDDDPSLEYLLRHLDASFPATLLAMVDERGMTDAQVYARANLSRQYFSKLRSGSINPSKRVVLSLAVALRLSLPETRLLLERAGYALTHTSKFDIIVEWFISHRSYDVFDINQVLFRYDQPLLGAS